MKKKLKNKRTEIYIVKKDTPSLRNNRHGEKFNLWVGLPSHGWGNCILFKGIDYDITNLKLIDDHPINDTFYDVQSRCRVGEKEVNWSHYYCFELWDEQGHIGDYKVEQVDFEENFELISNEERPTQKEYWDTYESASKKYSLFSPDTFANLRTTNTTH